MINTVKRTYILAATIAMSWSLEFLLELLYCPLQVSFLGLSTISSWLQQRTEAIYGMDRFIQVKAELQWDNPRFLHRTLKILFLCIQILTWGGSSRSHFLSISYNGKINTIVWDLGVVKLLHVRWWWWYGLYVIVSQHYLYNIIFHLAWSVFLFFWTFLQDSKIWDLVLDLASSSCKLV